MSPRPPRSRISARSSRSDRTGVSTPVDLDEVVHLAAERRRLLDLGAGVVRVLRLVELLHRALQGGLDLGLDRVGLLLAEDEAEDLVAVGVGGDAVARKLAGFGVAQREELPDVDLLLL